ncbi:MAG TPA: hypothetical protein VFP58_08130 [Candidatus Eisenbacteria bacterium]|nr:hypothetical protein [Candidatus Eisenbacteria bacterium]
MCSARRVSPARFVGIVLAVSFAALCPAGSVHAATARIQYVTESSVYVDTGSEAGLVEGAAVTVERDGRVIARMTVVFAAPHSASCRLEPGSEAVRVGDRVTFTPAATGAARDTTTGAAATGNAVVPSSWSGGAGWRGDVALSMLRSEELGNELTLPSGWARLSYAAPGEQEFRIDLRAARPRTFVQGLQPGSPDRTQEETRLYEARVGYRRGDRLLLEGGRLLPRGLEGLGTLDGGAARLRIRPGLWVGAAGGAGADLGVAGFARGGPRAGGILEIGKKPELFRSWWRVALAGGMISDSSVTRRVYFTQRVDYWSRPGLGLFAGFEEDVNPSWKEALGFDAATLTAAYVSGTAPLGGKSSATLTLDSRASVLLLTPGAQPPPSVDFDRMNGIHVALRTSLGNGHSLRAGASARRTGGGDTRNSWDAGWTAFRIQGSMWDAAASAYGYFADEEDGVFGSAFLAARVTGGVRLEAAGGVGDTWDAPPVGVPAYRHQWARLGGEVRDTHGLWLHASYEWHAESTGNELLLEAGHSF